MLNISTVDIIAAADALVKASRAASAA